MEGFPVFHKVVDEKERGREQHSIAPFVDHQVCKIAAELIGKKVQRKAHESRVPREQKPSLNIVLMDVKNQVQADRYSIHPPDVQACFPGLVAQQNKEVEQEDQAKQWDGRFLGKEQQGRKNREQPILSLVQEIDRCQQQQREQGFG